MFQKIIIIIQSINVTYFFQTISILIPCMESTQNFMLYIDMAYASIQKTFFVLEYALSLLNKNVQRALLRNFYKKVRIVKLWEWRRKFKEKVCMGPNGQPPLSEEIKSRKVFKAIVRSSRKSVSGRSRNSWPPNRKVGRSIHGHSESP